MRASATTATVISPRARRGATASSHRPRPGARRAPEVTTCTTRDLAPDWRRPCRGDVCVAPTLRLRTRAGEGIVCLHDLLHELVSDDVAVVEVDEADALDVLDDRKRLDEPRLPRMRKIDLRDVAGDDRLRPEAQTGQEHLHLLGGRVLRLVEDDERVVEGAAAHE